MNPRRSIPQHIIIKMSNIKVNKRILKIAREKEKVVYMGDPIMHEMWKRK